MNLSTTGRTARLECPGCSAEIAPDDVNIELMVGLCRGCGSTVELTAKAAPPPELLKLAEPPAGVTVREEGGELFLRRRWFTFNVSFVFLAFWCLVWDGFLVVWYTASIAALLSGEVASVLMLLFPILHVVVGIGVTYSLVATVVNYTEIRVSEVHLEVTHGPLPWRGPQPMPSRAIDQFYLVQDVQKSSRTYSLVARRKDQTSEQLLTNLSDDTQARYMERRLEAWLGITDQAVDGEYTG